MAKKRKFITRRRLKWVGAVLCLFLAAMYIPSWSRSVIARTNSPAGTMWYVRVAAGRANVMVTRSPTLGLGKRRTEITQHKLMKPRWNLWLDWKREKVTNGSSVNYVFVPLWMPCLLLAVPTVWLWRTDRRAKPWQCDKCRYDQRGLVNESQATVCPECGNAANAEAKP